MSAGWDRRGFLRELIRSAVQTVDAVDTSLRDVLDETGRAELGLTDDTAGEETVPAVRARALASEDDLRRLCDEAGLAHPLAEEAASLARRSFRLTVGEGGSALGGTPLLPPGFEWPCREEEELTCLARVRLDELPPSSLPAHGTLVVFFALGAREDEVPDDASCRIVVVPDAAGLVQPDQTAPLPEVHVAVSTELTLPTEPVSAETGDEVEAWTELRRRLAALQGVELEELSDDYHALHRVLGYPDVFDTDMALDAARAHRGIDPDALELYADPSPVELAAAGEWTLLLQLSGDDELGLSFGGLERLLVWIRDEDLDAGRFDHVRAFVRC